VHTLLRLHTEIFYANGAKANVLDGPLAAEHCIRVIGAYSAGQRAEPALGRAEGFVEARWL
jgi:hypothetical protein